MLLDTNDGEELVDVVDGQLDDGVTHETPAVRFRVHVLNIPLSVSSPSNKRFSF